MATEMLAVLWLAVVGGALLFGAFFADDSRGWRIAYGVAGSLAVGLGLLFVLGVVH